MLTAFHATIIVMVLIASSNAQVRKRWRRAPKGMYGIREAAGKAQVQRIMADYGPTILLLDLSLPKLGRLAGLQAVQRLSPATKTILLTSRPDQKEGVSALKAGAKGYCHSDIPPILLRKALEVVQKGEIWIERRLISTLLEDLCSLNESWKIDPAAEDWGNQIAGLTLREREIARLLGSGGSNKEIANALNVSEGTVKAHLTRIFRKLGFSDRLRLALFVTEQSRLLHSRHA